MYPLIALLLMSSLFAGFIWYGRDLNSNKNFDADIVSHHLLAWHKAALAKCGHVNCIGGTVDPTGYFPPLIKDGVVATSGRFASNYDASQGHMVTYITNAQGNIRNYDYTQQDIFNALTSGISGKVSKVGYWNMAQNKIKLPLNFTTSSSGVHGHTELNIPADLPAHLLVGVPDGNVILLGNIKKTD